MVNAVSKLYYSNNTKIPRILMHFQNKYKQRRFFKMKKTSKKIISIACAALMAAQFMAVNASADTDNLYYYNGYFYEYPLDAYNAAGNPGYVLTVSKSKVSTTNMPVKYMANGVAYDTPAEAESQGGVDVLNHARYTGTYNPNSGSSTTPSAGLWYSLITRKNYSTYDEALKASGGLSDYVTYVGSSHTSGRFYSSYTGRWYSTYQAALNASNGNANYVTEIIGGTGTTVPGTIYKYYYKGVAYPTLDAAVAAGGTVGVDIYYSSVGSTGDKTNYYYYNGTYYGSLQAAINAGGTAVGVDISYVPYGYYGTPYYYYNGYYYNGYYYNGYYYNGSLIDPYYSYRQILNSNKNTSTSTKEAEDGEPFMYGKKTKAGWDTIVKYINAASKGANLAVDMNGSYVIDKSVLKALDGKDVSVTFVLDNGVKWTINGKKVTDPQDITIYTEYNIQYIPENLVKKAASGAVSKTQIGVSTSFDDLGTDANVTVKFSKKRSGCTAVVYRYDPDTNSLKGVSKAKVQSNGNCTFTVDAGGPYLIVLK